MGDRPQPSASTSSEGNRNAAQLPTASDLPMYDPGRLNPSGHSLAYLAGPEPHTGGTEAPGPERGRPSRYFDGISQNAQILGISRSDLLDSEAKSPFVASSAVDQNLDSIPKDLRPSPIQQGYEHHPFFDCIPLPSLRDKTILACSTTPPLINRFDLCYDMFAGGLTFRGDATIEQNWQYSDDFKLKWQALLNMNIDALQRHVENSQ